MTTILRRTLQQLPTTVPPSVWFRTSTKPSEWWQTRYSPWTSWSRVILATQTMDSTITNTVPKTKWVLPMLQMKIRMTRTWNFGPFVALSRQIFQGYATCSTRAKRRRQWPGLVVVRNYRRVSQGRRARSGCWETTGLSLLTTSRLRNCQTRN